MSERTKEQRGRPKPITEKDLARSGGKPKAHAYKAAPIHNGMASQQRGSHLGAPPTGAPPDASSPLPTDPTKQHGNKFFKIPAKHPHMRSDPERGKYDPGLAAAIFGEAARGPMDHGRDLHAVLPDDLPPNESEQARKP